MTALRDWLPLLLHYVQPWLSDRDIAARERWAAKVGRELEGTQYGIILTSDNLNAAFRTAPLIANDRISGFRDEMTP